MFYSYGGSELELGMADLLALRVYQIAGKLLIGLRAFISTSTRSLGQLEKLRSFPSLGVLCCGTALLKLYVTFSTFRCEPVYGITERLLRSLSRRL